MAVGAEVAEEFAPKLKVAVGAAAVVAAGLVPAPPNKPPVEAAGVVALAGAAFADPPKRPPAGLGAALEPPNKLPPWAAAVEEPCWPLTPPKRPPDGAPAAAGLAAPNENVPAVEVFGVELPPKRPPDGAAAPVDPCAVFELAAEPNRPPVWPLEAPPDALPPKEKVFPPLLEAAPPKENPELLLAVFKPVLVTRCPIGRPQR